MWFRWGHPSNASFRGVFGRQIGGLGSAPEVAAGGFRGVFMRQIGGLGSPAFTPPTPAPPSAAGGPAGFRSGVRRRRAEYVDYFKRQRRHTEEIERLEAREQDALAKAEAAAQALEDAEATERADAQYTQSIARLAALSDQAERTLEAITTLREQAERDADDEDAIALLLLH